MDIHCFYFWYIFGNIKGNNLFLPKDITAQYYTLSFTVQQDKISGVH